MAVSKGSRMSDHVKTLEMLPERHSLEPEERAAIRAVLEENERLRVESGELSLVLDQQDITLERFKARIDAALALISDAAKREDYVDPYELVKALRGEK